MPNDEKYEEMNQQKNSIINRKINVDIGPSFMEKITTNSYLVLQKFLDEEIPHIKEFCETESKKGFREKIYSFKGDKTPILLYDSKQREEIQKTFLSVNFLKVEFRFENLKWVCFLQW